MEIKRAKLTQINPGKWFYLKRLFWLMIGGRVKVRLVKPSLRQNQALILDLTLPLCSQLQRTVSWFINVLSDSRRLSVFKAEPGLCCPLVEEENSASSPGWRETPVTMFLFNVEK